MMEQHISNLIPGSRADLGTASPEGITELLIDSRSLLDPAHTIFFAIPTTRDDGHRYIPELYAKGVRSFVVTQEFQPSLRVS